KRRTEIGLILLNRRKEGVRIPCVSCRLWREVCDIGCRELLRESQNIFRTCTPAVDQDRYQPGVRDRWPGAKHRLGSMDIWIVSHQSPCGLLMRNVNRAV